ncbi:MAG TPA: tetratricopeptide repeat protein [Rhizomicrobium sp.]|nr:tetratricopeptide repeat protein [Rhizomicrobium sp.]
MTSRLIPALAVLLVSTGAWAAPAKHPKPAEPPVTVESLLSQAHDAISKGDTDLAVRLAQSAIVADPARPTSYVALGDIYAQAGQADYARSYYDEALGIDPSQPDALKALSALDRDHPEHTARANP